jgi:hypothetical protein
MACVYVLHLASSPEDIRYVGISKYDDQIKRFKSHKKTAASGRKTPLYAWMRKHLDNVETTVVLSNISWEEACAEEQRLIALYRSSSGSLLNLTDGGDGPHGYTHTAEAVRKISKASRGRKHSDESRKRIAEANTGKTHSLETRSRLSEINKGKSPSEATKAKLSKANKGRLLSEEHRKKISESQKGRTFSDETRRKMSEAAKNRLKT